MRKFPFEPKSSLSLSPGDFWGFKLKDGTWACGRVLQLRNSGPNSRMWFFGALLDWNGAKKPNADSIAGARALRQGTMHIDSIKRTGINIEGTRSLTLDGIEPWLCISGNDVQRGHEYVRAWRRQDTGHLPTFAYWQDLYIWAFANHHFLGVSPADDELPILPTAE